MRPSSLVSRFDIRRVRDGVSERVIDAIAVEEPLQVTLAYSFKQSLQTTPLAVTMRTPGNDRELAAGLLLSEGIIRRTTDIVDIRTIGDPSADEILVELLPGIDVDDRSLARRTVAGASCGICGKQMRDAISMSAPPLPQTGLTLNTALIQQLPELLVAHQQTFEQTGGAHAAALVTSGGHIQAIFEDIGRHNALDKLMGHALLNNEVPLHDKVVVMSSRSSFELVQKAAMGGVPVLATVGGPSSLAVEAARDCGMTLIGFVRSGRFNVYSGEWRLHS